MLRLGAALFLVCSFVGVGSTRAGELDQLLEGELSRSFREKLVDEGFEGKSLGFLPFRSQVGEGSSTFNGGSINTHFPEMLALSLIATDDAKRKTPRFRILRDIADTAAKENIGKWFAQTAERRKMFKTEFPVLWSTEKSKPDAIITGLIRISEDGKETFVRIESFTVKDLLKPTTLVETSLPTTPSLLRALGVSYELPAELVKKAKNEREAAVLKEVGDRGMKVKPPGLSPESVGGLKLELFYDGNKQKVETSRGKRGELEFHLPSPKKGQKVTMSVTHLDQDKVPLGFVLRVNGENTWAQERLDPEQCQPWLLKPAKSMVFSGFSFVDPLDGKYREQPWKVLSEEESIDRVADFGDKIGTIDLDVFAAGEEIEEIPIAMDRSVLTKTSSFDGFRKSVAEFADSKSRKVKSRGVLVRDENVTAKAFETEKLEFNNPVPRAGITVRYYAPSIQDELPVTEK